MGRIRSPRPVRKLSQQVLLWCLCYPSGYNLGRTKLSHFRDLYLRKERRSSARDGHALCCQRPWLHGGRRICCHMLSFAFYGAPLHSQSKINTLAHDCLFGCFFYSSSC